MLSDWRLDPSGQIADLGQADLGAARAASALPSTANSTSPAQSTAAPGARVRLRLANAATARVMGIAIEGAKTSIVAVDGQPSEAFEPLHDLVPMGSCPRFELMFDMPREAGAQVRFMLRGGDLAAVPGEPDRPMIVSRRRAKRSRRVRRSPRCRQSAVPREIGLERAKRVDLTIRAAAPRRSPSTELLLSTGRQSRRSPFRADRRSRSAW